MDSMIVDVTDIETEKLKVGSYVELINEDFIINLNKNKLDLNVYELFTLISNRVIRKYV